MLRSFVPYYSKFFLLMLYELMVDGYKCFKSINEMLRKSIWEWLVDSDDL